MDIVTINRKAKLGASLAYLESQGSGLAGQATTTITSLVQLHAEVLADPACDATDLAAVKAALAGFLTRADAFYRAAHAAMDSLV